MALRGINHVALKVRDLERSRQFYELIGFELVGHRQGMLFLSVGGHHHHIALNEVGEQARRPPKKGLGMLHFAVTVDEESELGRLYRLVKDNGYKIVYKTDHIASRSIYVEDPDGNVVELTYDVPKPEWQHLDNPLSKNRELTIPGEEPS